MSRDWRDIPDPFGDRISVVQEPPSNQPNPGLDVERLARAMSVVAGRLGVRMLVDDDASAIAAEYARLSGSLDSDPRDAAVRRPVEAADNMVRARRNHFGADRAEDDLSAALASYRSTIRDQEET